ncbi:hypothetical protein ABZP36_019464 [Zizania latifolia]
MASLTTPARFPAAFRHAGRHPTPIPHPQSSSPCYRCRSSELSELQFDGAGVHVAIVWSLLGLLTILQNVLPTQLLSLLHSLWKHGYLLQGLPGSSKSLLIASVANHLR